MAAAPDDAQRRSDSWNTQENQSMVPGGNHELVNNATSLSADDRNAAKDHDNPEYVRSGTGELSTSNNKGDPYRGEKQVKPNKVYVGGLPETTRQEDLRSCFGKLGNIVNIEMKVGYGFVEFDSREAAEESVAKYHEGFFMGNKIRVELSHGGGRTAKFNGDPGACFKCGDLGHWARECPNANSGHQRRPPYEPPLLDRIQRDHTPSRSLPLTRDDYSSARYTPRDVPYDYPPPPQTRDIRRPPSPRDYRDYPPPPTRSRDYDDYRRGPPAERDRYGPPPPPDYRGRYAPPPESPYRSYGAPPPPPPPASYYERYDRRPNERYPAYPAPAGRARTPPRAREEYERDRYPAREYHPEYRGRPPSPQPSRYPEYSRAPVDAHPQRFRRRSQSPPARASAPYEPGYANGYSGPPPVGQTHRNGARDYAPPRGGREPLDVNSGYRRT